MSTAEDSGITAAGSEEPAASIGRLAATVARLRREVQAAHTAAEGRALVEMAKGVLVERLSCGPQEAARQLADLAARAGVSQLELAADIVNRVADDRLTEAAVAFVAQARRDGEQPAEDEPSVAVRLRTAEGGALAAHDAQAVAAALLDHALAPLGASAVAIWAAASDGSLALRGHAGFGAEESARWRHVPPGVATVARRALAERRTVWLRSLGDAGLPSIGLRDLPGGRAAVPAGTGGRIHGVLEICWPHPLRPQTPQVRRQVEALAELCAHTLDSHSAAPLGDFDAGRHIGELVQLADGLHDPALLLVPQLGADGKLVDFRIHHANANFTDPAGRPRHEIVGALLLEAYPMAANDGDLFDMAERVYATGEAFRADRVTVTTLIDQVPLTTPAGVSISRHDGTILLLWRVENEATRLAGLLQHAQRLGNIGGFEEVLPTGEIVWNAQMFDLHGLPRTAAPRPLEELPSSAHPDDAVAIGRFLRTLITHRRPASAAFRLRRSDGITRHIRVAAEPVLAANGDLFAVRGAFQDISAQHWTEVALAATRDQLAQSERQSAQRNRLALQLQHAIMPPENIPLDAPGLAVAVRYRPAESEAAVGGDWYDCVVLPSKQVLLCVGDVAGHGIDAATGMVVLRNALRGLSVTGAGPAQLLGWLNMVAHHLTGQVTATVVCGIYDPADRVLRWARAGHLPPILVRDGDARPLPLPEGLLLGALADAEYEEAELQLAQGDTLLMYTDGLIERRDRSVHDTLGHLVENARGAAPNLDLRLDRLLVRSKADTDDDTCIIGIDVV